MNLRHTTSKLILFRNSWKDSNLTLTKIHSTPLQWDSGDMIPKIA